MEVKLHLHILIFQSADPEFFIAVVSVLDVGEVDDCPGQQFSGFVVFGIGLSLLVDRGEIVISDARQVFLVDLLGFLLD